MKKSFGARLKALFGIKTFDENFFEELEDMLIEGDLGAKTAMEVSDAVRKLAKAEKSTSQDALQQLMKRILSDKIAAYVPELVPETTNIFLILGVNGVGKTTSIAKLATYYKNRGETVLLAAADTFRAAAIDQLELHAQRTGCRIVKQSHGSDPGAVIFDAMQSAKAKGEHLVLADTAGRMHNKENLLRELQKIDKVVNSKISEPACYKRFLVIDATTGQNGLSQAQLFHQAIGIDALILTKYDSAAKGGSLVQIGEKLGIPIAFVGVGERYGDLYPFDKDEFLDSLVGIA
ncbi:MAG: signal recognition particle-docking protein FtsY [Spirochaetae bacterium HGW-Spirochaetae-4]|jgi:fused signal recognition particle receptor|nr:MAG: signal recognition particle-docking protein FtsY [Spirochaetes bacterium GWC2_52_13]OHD64573.1 MAG: signal recognition particle-docking protein FtsY [Spirochaetes bacterium GWF2_52_7]PKL12047.1 MAG: signal recognition particle-docking protein FtsY [Spirochaetae bacterium HGW-Spirochaetae-8]PKL21675.1 MAG: signal recognition particle-docking protein FtsY [Spirochaetae bacterium HGW-Spirochaetae-4]HCG62271.1 signal recognition particle-docking protein FtsY [Sphaerochaeta sp.]